MTADVLFDFALRPLADVVPWGRPDDPNLHWFGLTDGHYWMDVGPDRLFEYSEAAVADGTSRCVDYQVSRLHEDVLEALPDVMEAVPPDLARHVTAAGRRNASECRSAWIDTQPEPEGDATWAVVDAASTWLGRRVIDTGYLTPSVRIAWWSDDTTVHIEWDNRDKLFRGAPAWTASIGVFELPRETFADEVRSFHQRLMHAMTERIQHIVDGALPPSVRIDIPALEREHAQRSAASALDFGPPRPPTDWQAVRAALRTIGA